MNIRSLVLLLCSLILCVICVIYLKISQQASGKQHKPYVVCTTNLIGDVLHTIAGDTIDLKVLMLPGVDPHSYKPIQTDLFSITQATIIFYHGLHLEARMADLFDQIKSVKKTVAVTQDIQPSQLIAVNSSGTLFDPHIWFDPNLWTIVIQTITKELCKICPQHQSLYEQNQQEYIAAIKRMYTTTKKIIDTIPTHKKILITSHDAFSYFSKAYHCAVMSLQGINTTSEAALQDMQQIINTIIARKIPTIFIESSIPARAMQAIAQAASKKNHRVAIGCELYSDSLGSPDHQAGNYIGMMEYNVHAIAQGLNR